MSVQIQSDTLAQIAGHNANMAKLISVIQGRFALSAFSGTFGLTASASFTVTDSNIKANSIILLDPANASAATLQGSNQHLYVSARSAGASFTVTTGAGTNAAGTERFNYIIVNVG
jgi:hypothetical protein